MLLGAGGAARAIVVALLDAGVPEIRLANRTGRAEALALADGLGPRSARSPGPDRADGAGRCRPAGQHAPQLGMAGQPPLDIDLARLPRRAVVYDIVYVPLETPLLAAGAGRAAMPVVDGLGMLLHQARPGFAAWFGREPEVDAALRDFVLAA